LFRELVNAVRGEFLLSLEPLITKRRRKRMDKATLKKTTSVQIEEESLAGGEVLGVMEITPVLVNYRDGHGQTETRVALVIPGGEVYFLTKDGVDHRPAQTWLKKGIVSKILHKGK
jgi:hypothetical protein